MKKVYIIIIFALLFTLISCNTTEIKNTVPKMEELQGKLTLWTISDGNNSLKLAADNFKAKNPKVEVNIVSYDSETLYSKLNEKFVSSASDVDLVVVDNAYNYDILNNYSNNITVVSNYLSNIRAGFSKDVLSGVTVNNNIMAFPWYKNVAALYYRKDIFDKAGIDVKTIKTWDDYILTGVKLVADNPGIKLLGINEKSEDDFFRLLLAQLRGEYIGADGKSQLSSEASIKAMTLFKKIYDLKLESNYSDVSSLVNQINNNIIVSMPIGAGFSETLIDSCPSQKGKWAIMKLPAFEAGGLRAAYYSGNSMIIPRASKNAKLAASFAKYAISDNGTLKCLAEKNGIMPYYAPSYDSLDLKAKASYFNDGNIISIFMDGDNLSYDIKYQYIYNDVRNEIIETQCNILEKNLSIKSALTELSLKLNESLPK